LDFVVLAALRGIFMRQTPCVFALPSSRFPERRLHRRFEHGKNMPAGSWNQGIVGAFPRMIPFSLAES
jgi:hypothetical protein